MAKTKSENFFGRQVTNIPGLLTEITGHRNVIQIVCFVELKSKIEYQENVVDRRGGEGRFSGGPGFLKIDIVFNFKLEIQR